MLDYPRIDPVAFSIGPLEFHWYGLMYLFGFAAAWWLGRLRARRDNSRLTPSEVDDLIFHLVIGLMVGARLGYALFYEPGAFVADPWLLFKVWQGGMSFHGGLVGVAVAVWVFARRRQKRFFDVVDHIAPLAPIGLGLGRIGNFINAELWGRPTDAPWGMIFPDPFAGMIPRHPSQLYEAFLEGLVLFVVLWLYTARPRPRMAPTGLFLLLYGIFRFGVEFFRQPDVQLGFVALDALTMGQVLCLPMIALGAALLWLARKKEPVSTT